mgnify:CR=1 FL=1
MSLILLIKGVFLYKRAFKTIRSWLDPFKNNEH